MVSDKLQRLRQLLPDCMLAQRRKLESALATLGPHTPPEAKLDRWLFQAEASRALREKRKANRPRAVYPPALPISQRKDDILELIQRHPVVVIAGETGSGKTTQVPKICLEAGLGISGKIACTQPRRIAALSISRRVAEELSTPWGRDVGCKIRFTDQSSPDTYIKFMTDGILLAEIQADRFLDEYDAIIIDEAHERSLNIDFLLGYLRRIRAQRPELKIVIMSATIDVQAFSRAFAGAPIIEVSGRLFPVEVRYSPLDHFAEEQGEITYVDAAVKATHAVLSESAHGDILIFMPGERDIREVRDQLAGQRLPHALIIPMFGRLSSEDQQKVFAPVPQRKIIIATNIAETSLTIPGIRWVIDSGLARISRYNPRTRTKRLPIEAVSQSSAQQRQGRCGRVADGVCIRLYSEDELAARPRFTAPEIQRANLAEVILKMKAWQLGAIEDFPFIDPPQHASIKAGYQLLQELGALDEANRLTALGRDLGRLPVDPTLGRMILQAEREGVLAEVLVIASGLSIQDPRERRADAKPSEAPHAKFQDATSDFLTLLSIWNEFHEQWEQLKAQSQLRKFCRSHGLSYLRMREWTDIHKQLVRILDDMGSAHSTLHLRKPNRATDEDRRSSDARRQSVHRAILSGLLGHVGRKTEANQYQISGSRKAMVFPGSGLFERQKAGKPGSHPQPAGKQPAWMMAGEIVETSRLFLRTVAGIEPRWILDIGRHLCRSTFQNPRWNRAQGRVIITERRTLHGLELDQRDVSFSRVDAQEATRIFIRSALVEEDMERAFPFLEFNRQVRQRIEAYRTHSRKPGLPDPDEVLFHFYSERIQNISSVADLDRFVRDRSKGDPGFLQIHESAFTQGAAVELDSTLFPRTVELVGRQVDLDYAYAPGEDYDGITVRLTGDIARALSSDALEWLVPGLRAEFAEHLLRALPKALRRQIMPLDRAAAEIAGSFKPEPGAFKESLSRFIRTRFKTDVAPELWQLQSVPAHLRPRAEIVGARLQPLLSGRDLKQIQAQLAAHESEAETVAWSNAAARWERYDLTAWPESSVPPRLDVTLTSGAVVPAFPGFALEDNAVSLRLFRTQTEALQSTGPALRRLGELSLQRELAWLRKDLRRVQQFGPAAATLAPTEELQENVYQAIIRHLFTSPPLDRDAFLSSIEKARKDLPLLVPRLLDQLKEILDLRHQLLLHPKPFPALRSELDRLVPRDFPRRISLASLAHVPRYLKALRLRADRAALSPPKDNLKAAQVAPYVQALESWKKKKLPPAAAALVESLEWLIEEFKVSVFAQELGTAQPVSAKRLDQWLSDIEKAR